MQKLSPSAGNSIALTDILAFIAPLLAGLSPIAGMLINSILKALGAQPAEIHRLANSEEPLSSQKSQPLKLGTSLNRAMVITAISSALKEVREKGTVEDYARCVGFAESLCENFRTRSTHEK